MLVALIAAPSAAAKPKTTVTNLGPGSTGTEELYFAGLVKSPKLSCREDRKVTLYRAEPGKDKRIGADRSVYIDQVTGPGMEGKEWVWRVEVRHPQVGTYYGAATETGSCGGDKSKKYKLDELL